MKSISPRFSTKSPDAVEEDAALDRAEIADLVVAVLAVVAVVRARDRSAVDQRDVAGEVVDAAVVPAHDVAAVDDPRQRALAVGDDAVAVAPKQAVVHDGDRTGGLDVERVLVGVDAAVVGDEGAVAVEVDRVEFCPADARVAADLEHQEPIVLFERNFAAEQPPEDRQRHLAARRTATPSTSSAKSSLMKPNSPSAKVCAVVELVPESTKLAISPSDHRYDPKAAARACRNAGDLPHPKPAVPDPTRAQPSRPRWYQRAPSRAIVVFRVAATVGPAASRRGGRAAIRRAAAEVRG